MKDLLNETLVVLALFVLKWHPEKKRGGHKYKSGSGRSSISSLTHNKDQKKLIELELFLNDFKDF